MKELTKAEEQIMQVLWRQGKGTVSTIIRILEKKVKAWQVAENQTGGNP